jgi:hypothetical protein
LGGYLTTLSIETVRVICLGWIRDTDPAFDWGGLRKTTKNLTEDNRGPDRDYNRTPPEFKSGALPLGHHFRYEEMEASEKRGQWGWNLQ